LVRALLRSGPGGMSRASIRASIALASKSLTVSGRFWRIGPVCGDVAQEEQEQRSPRCSLSLRQLCNFNFHLGASPSECSPKFGKCFTGHKKSYRVYPRRRALVRDGYLQADTKHCDDPITQLVAEKIIAIGRTGIENPAEISNLALKELGLP
jgi:hypothetical protein